jgi:hypothetical protein
MPIKIRKVGGRYRVSTPGGVKAKGTTREKALAQARLLRGVEHGWKPTGKKKRYSRVGKKRYSRMGKGR